MSYGFGYLNDLVEKVGTWASATFTKATPASICEHLRREVAELTDCASDSEEAADCVLLLFHLAHEQGWNLEQAIINKFEKNKARKWGELDAQGVVEHVCRVCKGNGEFEAHGLYHECKACGGTGK